MAVSTVTIDLTSAWQEIFSGPGDVIVQLKSGQSFKLHGGQSAPANNIEAFLTATWDSPPFSAAGLETGDKLYAALRTETPATIVVMKK
jgi:hypothetical protein